MERGKKKRNCVGENREAGLERDIGRKKGGRERERERVEEVGRCGRVQFIMLPFLSERAQERTTSVKYSEKDQETAALDDVTQLQCWNNAHRSLRQPCLCDRL